MRHVRLDEKILVVCITLIVPVYSIICLNARCGHNCDIASGSGSGSECEDQDEMLNQVKVTSFTQELISGRLGQCFIIQLRNRNLALDQHFSATPTIDVDLRTEASKNMFQNFNLMNKRFLIRFQEQCIIYYIHFRKDDQQNKVELDRLTKVLGNSRLLPQAHQSYIFLNDYENPLTQDQDQDQTRETAASILLHPSLKYYEHKVWFQPFQDRSSKTLKTLKILNGGKEAKSKETKMTYTTSSYCYFCKNGQEGILSTGKRLTQAGDVKNLLQLYPDVTSNMYGRALHVTAAMALPFVGIIASKTNPKDLRIEGMQGTILRALAKALNFTVVIENTSGGSTGSNIRGKWTGTIGEVLYGRSDVGLNAAISYERNEYVDFTVSAFHGFLVLVSTKPSPFFEWKAIFYPFEVLTWLGISASTLGTILSYRFFLNNRVALKLKAIRREDFEMDEKKRGREPSRKRPRNEKVSFLRVCYITIGSLLEQGIPFEYSSTPAKVIAAFWLMFTIVASCAYKSKLFLYLTFPIIKIPPSTFQELHVSDYTWGLQSLGGLALLFITKSPVHYITEIGDKMEIYRDKYSCMDKTFSEKFICIIYRASYDYMSAVRFWKVSQKFHVSDYVTPPVGSAWVIPKYSPLVHPVDKLIHAQFEMGLSGIYVEQYIKTMALRSRTLALSSNDTKELFAFNTQFKRTTILEKPLEFANLYAGFLLLFFGTGISMGILIFETWKYKGNEPTYGITKQLRQVKRIHGLHVMRSHKGKEKKVVRFKSSSRSMLLTPTT